MSANGLEYHRLSPVLLSMYERDPSFFPKGLPRQRPKMPFPTGISKEEFSRRWDAYLEESELYQREMEEIFPGTKGLSYFSEKKTDNNLISTIALFCIAALVLSISGICALSHVISTAVFGNIALTVGIVSAFVFSIILLRDEKLKQQQQRG